MNPTKTIVDQTEAALRLFFADTREEAARLLEMYGPLRRMREVDFATSLEVWHLVLDRFPADEPPSVPGLDWLPAVEADAKQIVAEVVEPAVVDWSRYGECPVCAVAAGACVFVAIVNRQGQPRETPHEERPLVEVQPDAEAVA